jgi:hypothetical protein
VLTVVARIVPPATLPVTVTENVTVALAPVARLPAHVSTGLA